jgi:polyhydroxyalkanoate synthesis regulator phasin
MHSLNAMMPGSTHKELFQNAMNTNALYFKLQEFYKPFFQAFQTKDFSFEGMKNLFDPANYKKVTEELFTSFFPTTNLNTMLESNMKMVKDFFANNTTVNKDFQEYWKLFTDKFPHLISGDFAKFTDTFKGFNTSLTETFSPMMKLVAPSKEKENVELAMVNFDKATAYQLKLNELQNHLYKTGQHVSTDMFTYLTEKMKETTMTTSFQPFFNEWVNINEKHYTTLFSTEEFSKLKADLTTLSFEIKKNLEKQFENRIESLPLVVKSEMDELYKTIHDLKKTVKTLENKLSTETTTTRTTTKKAATV